MSNGDKVALLGENNLANTVLIKILAGELNPTSGTIKWGQTARVSHFPSDNDDFFNNKSLNLIDWLRPYSKEPAESYLRGFLGRMLFSGDQALKEVKHLSGGERMRCMYSKLMLSQANTLLIDAPTNHLDLESIQAVNKGFEEYKGAMVIASHDHTLLQSVCNKIVEIGSQGALMYEGKLDEYLTIEELKSKRLSLNQ